eukprot:356298-Chlamydomonas_euryale.AAC.9
MHSRSCRGSGRARRAESGVPSRNSTSSGASDSRAAIVGPDSDGISAVQRTVGRMAGRGPANCDVAKAVLGMELRVSCKQIAKGAMEGMRGGVESYCGRTSCGDAC